MSLAWCLVYVSAPTHLADEEDRLAGSKKRCKTVTLVAGSEAERREAVAVACLFDLNIPLVTSNYP